MIIILKNSSQEEEINMMKWKDKIVNKAPIGICLTDKEGYFEFVNPGCSEIYGYEPQELIGQHFSILATADNKEKLKNLYDKFIAEEKELEEELRMKTKGGKEIEILAHAIKVRTERGEPKKITFVIEITERKRLERELHKENQSLKDKAIRDSLTNLYNYGEIMNRLDEEINRARREELSLTIMMLDIDDFTLINNRYGHVTGDKILEKVSDIFNNHTREMDICGRYGGDEFLLIFPDTTVSIVSKVAGRIKNKLDDNNILNKDITISAGIAQLQQKQNRKDLVQKADELLYRAKSLGKNRISIGEQGKI